MGLPLYGYEWETIGNTPRSGVIPGTGIIASNQRVEELLKNCTTCSTGRETNAQEAYVVYKDSQTGTYHQVFYPDQEAMQEKLNFAKANNLGGIALWALGYEGNSLLTSLQTYQ